MKRRRAHDLPDLIDSPTGDVKALLDRLAKIQALNHTLQDKLSATLLKHCRVVNLRKNTLVIAADSPVWANKLRFQQLQLVEAFRQSGYYALSGVDIIVKPRES